MPLNGKFIDKYGKQWDKMDDGEKQMAVMSEIFDLRESVEPVAAICKTIEKHKTYFRWIGIALVAILIPLLYMLIKYQITGTP